MKNLTWRCCTMDRLPPARTPTSLLDWTACCLLGLHHCVPDWPPSTALLQGCLTGAMAPFLGSGSLWFTWGLQGLLGHMRLLTCSSWYRTLFL